MIGVVNELLIYLPSCINCVLNWFTFWKTKKMLPICYLYPLPSKENKVQSVFQTSECTLPGIRLEGELRLPTLDLHLSTQSLVRSHQIWTWLANLCKLEWMTSRWCQLSRILKLFDSMLMIVNKNWTILSFFNPHQLLFSLEWEGLYNSTLIHQSSCQQMPFFSLCFLAQRGEQCLHYSEQQARQDLQQNCRKKGAVDISYIPYIHCTLKYLKYNVYNSGQDQFLRYMSDGTNFQVIFIREKL